MIKTKIIFLIIGILIAAAVLTVALIKRKRANKSERLSPEIQGLDNYEERSLVESDLSNLMSFGKLECITEEEENRLAEIKDKNLIGQIDSIIPEGAHAAVNIGAIEKYNAAVEQTGQLYQAVIPKGAKLAKSRSMEGAVRGFYRGEGSIKGQANLLAVDSREMGKGLVAAGAVNAVMNIGAMVVGQYHMAQITDRLDSITDNIEKINRFHDTEYAGRILALIAEVRKCSLFQVVIMENEELRNAELSNLKDLESECAKLLGQANLMLEKYTEKTDLKYDVYEQQLKEANRWFQYQQTLLDLMERIEDLSYVLHLGDVSKEYCYAVYLPYAKQAGAVLEKLNAWHQKNGESLEIDVDAARRKRQGINGFFMNIPAVFDDSLHYKTISMTTASIISQQTSKKETVDIDATPDLFQEDVRIIIKEGKYYYLPPTNIEL